MGADKKQDLGSEKKLVMVVDDEPDMLSMLKLVVEKKCDCDVITSLSGEEALQQLEVYWPDVIVTDIKMPDLDGLDLLKRIKQLDPSISVVIMTGYGTIDMAVRALKDGAYDFLQKPFEKDHIVRVILNCLERTSLLRTNIRLKRELSNLSPATDFIGQSPPLLHAIDLLARVADTDATVLIQGESGTGKEVAARTLHNLSSRCNERMVIVNCPALPENVLESELFGYCKGAFTGADHEKKGLFQEAHGSSILLDEIADIPITIQTKLLRVLQEKEFQPLGQNRTIKVDVRVIASTNQDLRAKIAAGEFREDLFYRLNVVNVVMPGLTELIEDIPLLIHHFLEKFKKEYNRENLTLSLDLLQHLYTRTWQGNVRQLQNYIKRLVLLSTGDKIGLKDVDPQSGAVGSSNEPGELFSDLFDFEFNDAKAKIIERFSRKYLHNILSLHKGNVTNAAASCGLERQALQRIMRRYGIVSKAYRDIS